MSTPKNSVLINVTEENIAKGVKGDCSKCPISKALRAAGFKSVIVHADDTYFSKGKKHFYFMFGPKVEKWIGRFDEGKPVKPFSFRLVPLEV